MISERRPPEPLYIPDTDQVIFLAGPIQGAPNWQQEAVFRIAHLHNSPDTLHVLNPRREVVGDEFDYAQQVEWEIRGLERAVKLGGILFWFAARDYSIDVAKERCYAQTSRIEFGIVTGWRDYNPDLNVSIGIEPGYRGSDKYFRKRAADYPIPIFDSLENVCRDSINSL